MLKKIAVVGGIVAIAGLGLGGAAWAESKAGDFITQFLGL